MRISHLQQQQQQQQQQGNHYFADAMASEGEKHPTNPINAAINYPASFHRSCRLNWQRDRIKRLRIIAKISEIVFPTIF
jgi:hypothetical protein